MTVRHVVTWKMASADPEERAQHAAGVAARLEALVGVVPEILSLSVGVNMAHPEENWDVALIVDVADLPALEAYQVHPVHQDVVAFVRSVAGGRTAVDFEVSSG